MRHQRVFSQKLYQLRMINNYSARKLSKFLGFSDSYINKIENKKVLPTMTSFFQMCDVLNVLPEQFFLESDDETTVILAMKSMESTKTKQLSNIAVQMLVQPSKS